MMRTDQSYIPLQLGRFAANENGTTAIEYSLIAACISIAIIASAQGVGEAIMNNFYDKIIGGMEDATNNN